MFDMLRMRYANYTKRNNTWGKLLLLLSVVGGFVTSVLTINNMIAEWPNSIYPILFQTVVGAVSGWGRFYDFAKRMEACLGAIYKVDEMTSKIKKESVVTDEIWDLYVKIQAETNAIIKPSHFEKLYAEATRKLMGDAGRRFQVRRISHVIGLVDSSPGDEPSGSMLPALSPQDVLRMAGIDTRHRTSAAREPVNSTSLSNGDTHGVDHKVHLVDGQTLESTPMSEPGSDDASHVDQSGISV